MVDADLANSLGSATSLAVASVIKATQSSVTLAREKAGDAFYRPPPMTRAPAKKFKPYEGYTPKKKSLLKSWAIPTLSAPFSSPKLEATFSSPVPATPAPASAAASMQGANMDEMLERAMREPSSVKPADLSAALPALQQQLEEAVRAGISPQEVEEVKRSFVDMGIDVDALFKTLDQMEAEGEDTSLGADGKAFFRTLRKVLL